MNTKNFKGIEKEKVIELLMAGEDIYAVILDDAIWRESVNRVGDLAIDDLLYLLDAKNTLFFVRTKED